MANDSESPKIVADGDVGPLRQKLRQLGEDFKRVGTEGEKTFDRLSNPLEALQSKFVAIGALLAGGAVFKEAVAQTVEFTEESIKLGRALDITEGSASVLRETLIAGNTSQEEFVSAAQGLAKQLRTNESALQAAGLKTRDAAGNLRPLNDLTFEAIDLLKGYRTATDRAVAGQTLFGKGFEITSNLAELNKQQLIDTEAKMRDLGMIASQESVAAWKAYDDATDDANLTLKGIRTTIGNALMPVLTKLANWFAAVGPAAVTVIRGALGGLISMFWGLKLAAGAAFQLINAAVIEVAEPIRAVSVAFWKLIHGDFEGAKAEIANIPKVWSQAWDTSFDNIAKDATETRDKIWNLFAEGTPTVAPEKGTKTANALVKKEDPKSNMAAYEAELAMLKNRYESENLLRQFSKEQELAFWRDKLVMTQKGSNDALAITKKTATLELEIRRKNAKDQQDLEAAVLDSYLAAQLARLDAEQQSAQFALDNGTITKSQMIALEQEFARRRFEIAYQAQLQRIQLAEQDPTQTPAARARLNEQLLDLERQYQMKRAELNQKKGKEDNKLGNVFDDAGQAFGNMAQGLLTRAQSLQSAMLGIFQSIGTSIVQNLVTKPMAEWIAGQARMLAAKLGFMSQDNVLDTAAASQTVGIKTAEATEVNMANATEAATGAAKSQAGIPIVGPVLALAAMAAMFAAVTAMGSRKSAARGYDIPKGLNPLVQTHEEEMILPQKYANVIRGLGQQSEMPGTAGDVHLHVHSLDAGGVKRWFLNNSNVIAPALRRLDRNFTARNSRSPLGKEY